MPSSERKNYFLASVSLIVYLFLAYRIQRQESIELVSGFAILFFAYLWVYKKVTNLSLPLWIYASFLFRLAFLFALPSLSDDFYRFIWDGRLMASGIHPFAELPSYYLSENVSVPGIDQGLFDRLNSQAYFTIYPPLAQYVFMIAAIVSPDSILGSVVVMRIFILAAEAASLFLLWKLLPLFTIDRKHLLIYALNPLVILELTGNLHFEAFVIFFILFSIYMLLRSNVTFAGVGFGLAIAVKLLPLMLLPQFLTRLGLRKSLLFYLMIWLTCVLLFLPLLSSEIIYGFGESFGLYFKRFEFNASIYYLVREYGFYTKGFNIIQSVGWKLALISTFGILMVSFWPLESIKKVWAFKKGIFPVSFLDTPRIMMWVMLIYFLFATTIHPWYITTLLMFTVFTHYRFVVIWSALIFLTYTGYNSDGYTENLIVVGLEYVVVIGYLVYELLWKEKKLA